MLTTYSSIYDHCSHFALDTFPGVVSLANTVVNYAKDTETYYPAMDKLFNVLLDESEPNSVRAQAASDLRDISHGLETRTNQKAVEVQNVSKEIHAVSCSVVPFALWGWLMCDIESVQDRDRE
jgi:hypothetical protein